MLRKVLQSGRDYPQSCSFSRKLFQFVLPVILEGGNHLNVSQQLIQLTSVLDQYGLVQYCANVIQTKIVEFRYLFFRNFIELSCESSWKFSPALRVPRNPNSEHQWLSLKSCKSEKFLGISRNFQEFLGMFENYWEF